MQVILEPGVQRRLAYAWHLHAGVGSAPWQGPELVARWARETRSKVAFDIEEVGGGAVKRTWRA